MKSYMSLFALALGLFFAFSTVDRSEVYAGGISCAQCKAAIPASTKPVVEMAKAEMKCSACQMGMTAGTTVSKLTCPACKAEMSLCAMCMKTHADAMAADAMSQGQKAMGEAQQAWGQAQQSMDEAAKKTAGQ